MRYRSIQILRALAALLVVFHHLLKFPLGAAGVDLFFVISGFIIASVAPEDRPWHFLAKRAARIYPIYWICQAPFFAYAAWTSNLSVKLGLASLTLMSFGTVSRPVLGVGWTLMFEVYFYLVAAVCLAMEDYRPALLAFLLLFVANALTGNESLGFFGHPIIFEFLAGAVLAIVPRSRTAATIAIAFAAAILAAVFHADLPWSWVYAGSSEQLFRVAYWGLPAALTVYAALVFEPSFAGRLWTPFVALGDASYALYLLMTGVVQIVSSWPWALALSVGLAIFMHRWIERPIGAALMKKVFRKSDFPPVAPTPAALSA